MRMLLSFVIAVAAGCGGGSTPPVHPSGGGSAVDDPGPHTQFADDAEPRPPYDAAALGHAIDTERGAIETAEKALEGSGSGAAAEYDPAPAADLAVRRQFLAMLETCRDTAHGCPPRLDDPKWAYDPEVDTVVPLETPLRFDLASWQAIAEELHAHACACRTIGCVDATSSAIDDLEQRPMPDVRGDDAASISITRARECLFRLRGKALVRGHAESAADAK